MVSSSSARFVDAALRATGDKALSYTHHDLKWLIRDHLLSLLEDFPTLSPHSDTFTNNDGTAVHLLHAQGVLPVSSSMPHVLVTIWLHQAYPFEPPLVYIFPTSSQSLLHDHPFVEPSGAVASPYLNEWNYPMSNLRDLARNLVKIFRLIHPYSSSMTSHGWGDASLASKREAIDRLFARLHRDTKQFQAQIEADVERFGSMQLVLRDRAAIIDSGLRELKEEKLSLKKALKEKVNDADVLSTWLRLHGLNSLPLDEVEGFKAADERERCLLEKEAAASAIDDVVYALDKALEAEVLDFATYIKQVRSLARAQFFHRA